VNAPLSGGGAEPSRYELHCHLDGSVRLPTLLDLALETGHVLTRPIRELAVAPPDVGSLAGFLPYLDIALRVLQEPAELQRAARDLVHDWHGDGVVYGEARFAPQLHTQADMTIDDAIRAASDGLREGGAATGVTTGLILCCLRHQPLDTSLAVVDAAVRNRDLVAGVDLAGDEAYPGAAHREAFDLAHSVGLPVTIHAGEAAGPASVWEAIDVLGARRIGHGVRSVRDEALIQRLRRDGIALEMCPACNVLTQAVPSISDHPADRLLRRGLAVTISTDTRTTADTTLGRELSLLADAFGWTAVHWQRVQDNARDATFATSVPRSS
jgi:adenosine deaminase